MPPETARAAPRIPVARLFAPRRVAVFGASDDRSKWGGRIMHYLDLHGFPGEIVPINPRRAVVGGRTCYPRIGDAPAIDVAVVAVPASAVPAIVAECAAAGVGACVIISSGFAEAGAEGEALQAEIVRIARQSGMRLVGPNCLGLINLLNGMALTSARVLEVDSLVRGRIGLVSQSGAIMLSVYNRAHDAGIGFSQLVSVGNQADLETCDFLEHMIGDPDTGAICLHIEGLADGARLLALLRRASAAGKPVVILKTGRSQEGEAAARSHTASLAGSYPVFAAACRSAGAILVDDPDVMVLAADFLLKAGPYAGGGVAILSPSGGMNGIVVDRLADHDVPLATFGAATQAALSSVLLPTHLANPIDLGASRPDVGEGPAVARPAVQAIAADPAVGLILVPLTTMPNYETSVEALAGALRESGKPSLVVITPGSVASGVRALLRRDGILYCDRIDDALRTLDAWRDCRPGAGADAAQAPEPLPPPAGIRSGYLSEPEAKALIGGAGIPVTREETVRTPEEAAAAAQRIGFPVVLKGVSRVVVHKSDAGLVRLGLADAGAVAHAFTEVREILRRLDPEAGQCVVAEMASGAFELIAGVKQDPVFGPAVLVGAGGVWVEVMGDVEVAPAPLSHGTARAMIERLRIAPILRGARTGQALDIDAAADVLVKLGRLALSLEGRLQELDINPLLVRKAGEGVIALDARAVIG